MLNRYHIIMKQVCNLISTCISYKGSDESATSKIFIEFVALIIRNRMYNYLKDEMEEMANKPNYMTVPAAIRELGMQM